RGPQVVAVMATLLVLSWITILLRCYVRTQISKSFGLDDWLAVAALAFFTAYGAFIFDATHWGSGRHTSSLSPHQYSMTMRSFFMLEITFLVLTATIKFSVSALLLRLAIKRLHIWIIYAVCMVVFVFSIAAIFVDTFMCHPTTYFWTRFDEPKPTSGSCQSASTVANISYFTIVISFITDVTLAVLPGFIIWESRLSPRDKVSVIAILALASLAGISALIRIPYNKSILNGNDVTYVTADLNIWACVEPGLGIIASSVATLRPLFRNFFSRSKLFGSST
ncbi:hypothetical protein K432DRAFT_249536, partial [Lepidopterella palustris CBS 459.81]